jgi:Cytochrome c oxidase subunit IV
MRTEYKIFGAVAVFLFAAATLYALWTNGQTNHTEMVGTVALILSGLLCSMCGGFFWFVARRIDLRPEDRSDADIAEGAGEVGFFSPGSYWPFGIALAAATAGVGLAFVQWWIVGAGLICVVVAACGLLFEYYSGTRHTAEH